jgi:hypothetical protein
MEGQTFLVNTNKDFAKIAVQYAINLSGKAPPISVFCSICPVWLLLYYGIQVTGRNISCQVSWMFFFIGRKRACVSRLNI